MPLLGALRLVDYLREYRLVHIEGKLGGGKTSIAVALNLFLCDRGYRFGSNLRCIFNEPLENHVIDPSQAGMMNSAFILDEGGAYFDDADQIKVLSMYAGKMDIIYLIPSFIAPHRASRILRIQPLYSYYSMGVPLVAYKYSIRSGEVSDTGLFFWLFPEEIYGTYSRQFPGSSALEILQHVETQTQAFERLHDTYAAASIALDKELSRHSARAAGTQTDAAIFQSLRDMEDARRALKLYTSDAYEALEETERSTALALRAADLAKKARRRRRG